MLSNAIKLDIFIAVVFCLFVSLLPDPLTLIVNKCILNCL